MFNKKFISTGSVIITLSFPILYIQCYKCFSSEQHGLYEFLYYGSFVTIFQVGWAIVQVAHLALIPEISENEAEKVELNSMR